MTSSNNHRGKSPLSKRALTPIGFLLITGTALAQQTVIEHCKKTSSDADRIACLEAALLGKAAPVDTGTHTQVDPPSLELETGPADTAEAPAPAKAVGIGAEQVIARTQTRDEILEDLERVEDLRVASYDKVPYERLLVTLENGQVWRQIKGDTQQIRVDLKRNQTVDITESSLSGYKLRLNEMRRMIRVERVR